MPKEERIGFTEREHKDDILKAQKVVAKMEELRKEKQPSMKTIRLGNGLIVSSTSDERLKQYVENYKKGLKFSLYGA